jgi:AraC-like DNA-binding protein
MKFNSRILRGLILLGRYNHPSAKSGLGPHSHKRAFEICYLIKGRQIYCVDGRSYSMRGGDVFVTFPDEIHDTGGNPQEKGVLYWAVISMDNRAESFLGLPGTEAALMIGALKKLPKRLFRGEPSMQNNLDAFASLYHRASGSLRYCAMANRMVAFLLTVIDCARRPTVRPQPRTLDAVFERIRSHPGEPMHVPELAALSGLSESRFKARFKEETGVPPGEYVMRTRIDEACRLLDAKPSSLPVTRIAMELGFSSSQYFATVFRRYKGVTPEAWRHRTK